MMKKLCFLAVIGALASSSAFAQQTCATAAPIVAPSTYSGDTTTGGHDIDAVGGLPLGGAPSAIYKFTAGATVDGTLTVNATFPWGLFVTTNCQATTSPPVAATASDAPTPTLNLTSGTFTAGTSYFVIISGNPGQAAATNAGPFTLVTTPNLPVTLQNFSID
jgi:hypothetical protein